MDEQESFFSELILDIYEKISGELESKTLKKITYPMIIFFQDYVKIYLYALYGVLSIFLIINIIVIVLLIKILNKR